MLKIIIIFFTSKIYVKADESNVLAKPTNAIAKATWLYDAN